MIQNNRTNSVGLALILILCIVGLSACKKIYHLSDAQEHRYPISEKDGIQKDAEVEAIIKPYREELDKIMNEEIGIAATTFYKKKPECTLGNWMADLLQEEANKRSSSPVDFSIQNYGGIRVPALTKGPITIGEIYEIMPFENQMIVIEARGIIVKTLFERIGKSGGWPVSNEIKFVAKPDGSIVKLLVSGKPVENTELYRFALPDYIANGGDRCDFLKNQKREELGVKIRDVIIEHLKASKESGYAETAKLEGRILIKK